MKNVKRMTTKVVEAQIGGQAWPAVSTIGDSLRASVCADTMEGVRTSWEALRKNLKVVRLKNKFSQCPSFSSLPFSKLSKSHQLSNN